MDINILCISNCANCDTKPIRLPPSPETCLIYNDLYCPDSTEPWIGCTANTSWGWSLSEWSSAMFVCDDFIRGDIPGNVSVRGSPWSFHCICPGMSHLLFWVGTVLTQILFYSEISQIYYSWGQLWRHLWGAWLLKGRKSNVYVLELWHVEKRKKVILVQLVHFFFLCKITKQQWWAVGYKSSFFSYWFSNICILLP